MIVPRDMETSKVFEAVVIGAGIMGSSTAYFLSKKLGNRVALIEQFDFLHRRGSSHGDSRITRLTYPQEYYTFLMKTSYELWSEAEAESGLNVFIQTGGLDFASKDTPAIHNVIAAAKKWNISHEVLTPAEVNARFPTITLPENYIGVYSPASGVLKASKAVGMFQNLARKNGCHLLDNANIVEIAVKKDSNGEEIFEITSTTHGIITAKKCVITAGAWTQKALDKVQLRSGKLSLTLPLKPRQVTVCYWEVAAPEKFSGINKTFPVFICYDDKYHVYGTPALEFPNLLKCCSHEGPNCDPDKRDFYPGVQEIENEVAPLVQKVFVGISPKPVFTESCMYTMSPDEDYIVDQVPGVQGLYVGAGGSGHAFKMGPTIGTMLAGFTVNTYKHFICICKFTEMVICLKLLGWFTQTA
ncbi:unnamed protein product [Allacma fusca]|uniref:FAD dependent oxidoreductase domain-containing protein n=1 Tax=Allacma fusca TaxID=39272 RepID=A0A8J2PAX7_9HEXA|nr:unnamed protein product [Allacma fusca]